MRAIHFQSRCDWRERALNLGFNLKLLESPPYWAEAMEQPFALEYSVAEIKAIAAASTEINAMALALVERICTAADSEALMDLLQIPTAFRAAVRMSWARQDHSLCGRLDLAVNGTEVKLLELNYDGAACLPEAAVLQLEWLIAMKENGALQERADQFNFIQENLLASFAADAWPEAHAQKAIHFCYYQNADEDVETVKYWFGLAQLAGLEARLSVLNDLKRSADGQIFDAEGSPVEILYKLYPWDHIFLDEQRLDQEGKPLFLPLLLNNNVTFLEPVWKTLISSKACLPLLWDMFPDHPLLLESYFEDDSRAARVKEGAYVRKPIFGWEGANIEIVFPESEGGSSEKNAGAFTDQGYIIQRYEPLPQAHGYHLVVGSWLAQGRAIGIGVRADQSKITGRRALFIPHYVV